MKATLFLITVLFACTCLSESGGWANNPADPWNIGPIVYFNNFNNDPLGTYTNAQLMADWDGPSGNDGIDDGRVSVIRGDNAREGKSLRVFFPAGHYGLSESGAHWNYQLKRKYEKLYCSYWVKFSDGFDFVREGKLPGLAGGTVNSGGSKPGGTDGWSARLIWGNNGKVAQYVYFPDQPGRYGQDFDWNFQLKPCYFKPGQWHHIENIIVMNSPGHRDGMIWGRFDGKPALKRTGIRFRDISSLGIDIFCFSTFFGGDSKAYASKKDGYIYFDDFQICMVN